MPSIWRGRRQMLWGGSRTSRTGRSTRGEEAIRTELPPRWTRSARPWNSRQGSRVKKDLQHHLRGLTSTLLWEGVEEALATDHLQGEEEEDEVKDPGIDFCPRVPAWHLGTDVVCFLQSWHHLWCFSSRPALGEKKLMVQNFHVDFG